MESDIYCDKVLNGKTPVNVIHESDSFLAFTHTKPSFPLHIVVIPKKHTADLITCLEENGKIVSEMMEVLKFLIQKVMKEKGGCRLTTNFGSLQKTKHLHWHIYTGDKMMQ